MGTMVTRSPPGRVSMRHSCPRLIADLKGRLQWRRKPCPTRKRNNNLKVFLKGGVRGFGSPSLSKGVGGAYTRPLPLNEASVAKRPVLAGIPMPCSIIHPGAPPQRSGSEMRSPSI
ncbi:unnamed protein product [Gadus morhua 'NCC']